MGCMTKPDVWMVARNKATGEVQTVNSGGGGAYFDKDRYTMQYMGGVDNIATYSRNNDTWEFTLSIEDITAWQDEFTGQMQVRK